MTPNLQSAELCRVRAITAFTVLPRDTAQWHGILAEAKTQCDTLAAACQAQGYTVQSVRIVSKRRLGCKPNISDCPATLGLDPTCAYSNRYKRCCRA